MPEVGQLAHVRGRRFVTVDVSADSPSTEASRHIVTLASVDDSLGEQLSVVWQAEPGAEAIDLDELPTPRQFDDPETLDAFLNAVRWGIVADIERKSYLSPYRSGIKIEDFQLDPLVRALQMPRANLLLADGVGLGKTIEAGLVIQEFVHRNRVQRILILCPSSLQIQWQEEMRDKFGLEFKIIDSEKVKEIRRSHGIHVNPWSHYPRLITSYDYLKQDHVYRTFRDLLPADGHPTYPRKFGLLVLDECHNVAPGGRGLRESQRTHLIKEVGPHFEHKLFLSATPHNGYRESFTALLELLDNQRYARGLAINRDQLHGVTMVRRLKSDDDLKDRFCKRDIEAIYIDYNEAERRAHRLLHEYTLSRRATSQPEHAYAVEFVLKTLKKRFFSSPAAIRRTLEKHLASLTEPRSAKKKATAVPLFIKRLIERAEEAGNMLGDEADDPTMLIDEAVEEVTRRTPQATPEEVQMIRELLAWARDAERTPDTKARRLFEWLAEHIKPNGQWTNERVIIFTEARDTQNWLLRLMIERGYGEDGRLEIMYGGMPLKDVPGSTQMSREKVKNAFLADPADSKVRILLATDTASEGANLHKHCCKLIHWETSWRPTVMEQRNGRVDRHGQPRDVTIYHFAPISAHSASGKPKDELDDELEFLFVAASKTNQIREDLGKFDSVIADQLADGLLGKAPRRIDISKAESEFEPVKHMLKAEIKFREEVARLREEYDRGKAELAISPENVRKVVEVGLKLAGQPPLQPGDRPGEYTVQPLASPWSECLRGLNHPFSGRQRPIVFDPDLLADRGDKVVLAHLNHRLVVMCLGLLRAQVWERDQKKLNRITVKSVPACVMPDPTIIVHGRLLVLGNTQQRLHEELLMAGGTLTGQSSTGEGKWERLQVGRIKEIVDAAIPRRPSDQLLANLKNIWPRLEPRLRAALDERKNERTKTLDSRLQAKKTKEQEDIRTVLLDLKRQLEEPQLTFDFSDFDARSAYEGLLKNRIAQIPQEIEKEVALIEDRYADPKPHLFPVSVTIYMPVKGEAG